MTDAPTPGGPPAGAPGPAAHVLVRVWLPDRPGALGLVASRIGATRGDIVGIDVLERGDGVALDEFAVEVPGMEHLPVMVREIEEVDGVSVEEVRVVGHFPDARLDGLESAARICESATVAELHEVLVAQSADEFLADWCALLRDGRLLAGWGGGLPAAALLDALATGASASPLVADGTTGPDDLALAPLPGHGATLLLGRQGHPFRRRERAQLQAVARVADRAWALLEPPA